MVNHPKPYIIQRYVHTHTTTLKKCQLALLCCLLRVPPHVIKPPDTAAEGWQGGEGRNNPLDEIIIEFLEDR